MSLAQGGSPVPAVIIARAYVTGLSFRDIRARYKVGSSTIYHALAKRGVAVRPMSHRRVSPERAARVEAVRADRARGLTYRQISEQHGISLGHAFKLQRGVA